MKQQWENISAKLEAMSLRERALIFAAVAVLLLSLFNMLLLEPMFAKQKAMRSEIAQQQKLMAAVQMQIAAMQQDNSPQTNRLNQLKQELAEGKAYLQSSRERLVQPERMAQHIKDLLNKNRSLNLVSLQTMPVSPLLDTPPDTGNEQGLATGAQAENTVFKHGVQITLRGNYLELLQYLTALEKLPQQMYWAKAQMSVAQYPTAELTLILYTLSLDKTWLQI